MAKSEAERKRRQRQGYRTWQVEVYPPSVDAALLAEELITEAQLEDITAKTEALSRFVERHCSVGRLLRDETTDNSHIPVSRLSGGGCWNHPVNFAAPQHHGRIAQWKPSRK